MNQIKNLKDLVAVVRQRDKRKRMVVVNASDSHTQEAVDMALDEGVIDVTFVGGGSSLADSGILDRHPDHTRYVDAADADTAAAMAVEMIRGGKADILMKGLINTDNLLRAILNKQSGILPAGNVLTQVTVADIPNYERLLFFTDAAVIPYPNQQQRIEQVRYVVFVCHAFGIDEPKVSLIHCSEKVDERHFPFTAGYAEIKEMAARGEFGRCVVDGPLDLMTSCSREALATKRIASPLDGEADALVLPDIEVGNVLHKALPLFAGATTASVLQGALSPVVLPSRGDSAGDKMRSIALAAL